MAVLFEGQPHGGGISCLCRHDRRLGLQRGSFKQFCRWNYIGVDAARHLLPTSASGLAGDRIVRARSCVSSARRCKSSKVIWGILGGAG